MMDDLNSCHQYIDEALQRWVVNNRIPVDDDSGICSLPPLKFQEPALWNRQELEAQQEGEDSGRVDKDHGVTSDKERTASEQSFVVYFIAVHDGSSDRTAELFGGMWPVMVDQNIADIWLVAADLAELKEDYDRVAACARLAGMIYSDIGNLSGALIAVSILERIGARALDHELVRLTRDYKCAIKESATGSGDKDTLFQALVDEARILAEQYEGDKAREKWNEALSLATDLRIDISRATCLLGLAGIEWQEGEIVKARDFFKSAVELYRRLGNQEGAASTLVSLAELECSWRDFSNARNYAEQALATYLDLGLILGQFDTLQRMTTICREEGEYDKTFEYYRKAMDIANSHKRMSLVAIVSSSIANLELALGRKAEAKVNYDNAIDIARRSKNYSLEHQILLDKARTLTNLAEYAEANDVLDRILSANDEDQDALSLKGWCLDFLGPAKADEAIKVREQLIKGAPNEIYRHRDLADALDLSCKHKEAEVKRRWIIAEFGVTPKPFDLSSLGWVYYKLGDFDKAAKALNAAIALSPVKASDEFDLALVLASVGQLANAVRAYERAISSLTGLLPPRRHLGLLFVATHDLEDLLARMPSLVETTEIAQMRRLLVEAKAAALA